LGHTVFNDVGIGLLVNMAPAGTELTGEQARLYEQAADAFEVLAQAANSTIENLYAEVEEAAEQPRAFDDQVVAAVLEQRKHNVSSNGNQPVYKMADQQRDPTADMQRVQRLAEIAGQGNPVKTAHPKAQNPFLAVVLRALIPEDSDKTETVAELVEELLVCPVVMASLSVIDVACAGFVQFRFLFGDVRALLFRHVPDGYRRRAETSWLIGNHHFPVFVDKRSACMCVDTSEAR
jgi:hypothetical protein